MPSDFPWRETIFGLLTLAEIELEEADAHHRAALARATYAKNAQVQYVQKMHILPARAAAAEED